MSSTQDFRKENKTSTTPEKKVPIARLLSSATAYMSREEYTNAYKLLAKALEDANAREQVKIYQILTELFLRVSQPKKAQDAATKSYQLATQEGVLNAQVCNNVAFVLATTETEEKPFGEIGRALDRALEAYTLDPDNLEISKNCQTILELFLEKVDESVKIQKLIGVLQKTPSYPGAEEYYTAVVGCSFADHPRRCREFANFLFTCLGMFPKELLSLIVEYIYIVGVKRDFALGESVLSEPSVIPDPAPKSLT